jgi:hypothetical protein
VNHTLCVSVGWSSRRERILAPLLLCLGSWWQVCQSEVLPTGTAEQACTLCCQLHVKPCNETSPENLLQRAACCMVPVDAAAWLRPIAAGCREAVRGSALWRNIERFQQRISGI